MCVIIDKPCGVRMAKTKLDAACNFNRDGFGYMYIHPETGKLIAERVLPKTTLLAQQLLDAKFDELTNVHAVFHLRYGTHGGETLSNVHPFQVLNKEQHGKDVWFMHNGVINIKSDEVADKGKSDTVLFNEYVLRPTLADCPALLDNHAYLGLLADYIGSSKLLFMDDTGKITRVGNWETNEGCVVSNNSYFTSYSPYSSRYGGTQQGGYSKAVTTTYSDWENEHGEPFEKFPSCSLTKKDDDIQAEITRKRLEAWRKENGVKPYKADQPEVDTREEETAPVEPDDDTFEGEEDMVMVLHTMKKVSELTVKDLMLMYTDDVEALIDEHPEVASVLVIELINIRDVEFYQDEERLRAYN